MGRRSTAEVDLVLTDYLAHHLDGLQRALAELVLEALVRVLFAGVDPGTNSVWPCSINQRNKLFSGWRSRM